MKCNQSFTLEVNQSLTRLASVGTFDYLKPLVSIGGFLDKGETFLSVAWFFSPAKNVNRWHTRAPGCAFGWLCSWDLWGRGGSHRGTQGRPRGCTVSALCLTGRKEKYVSRSNEEKLTSFSPEQSALVPSLEADTKVG